jgi:hypothetical protein
MRLKVTGILLRDHLRKFESRFFLHEGQRQRARSDEAGSQQRPLDLEWIELRQQPIEVKGQRNRGEDEKERHVSELIKSQEQEAPGKQP